MNYKILILSILGSIYFDAYSQKTQILNLKDSQYFSEQNIYWTNSSLTLYQEVNYNDPSSIDEEYRYNLIIQFRNNFEITNRNHFDLEKDSAFVNVKFKRNSVWDWTPYELIKTGYISVLSRKKNYIEIELGFTVVSNRYNSEFTYTGIRKFKKGKEPKYFE